MNATVTTNARFGASDRVVVAQIRLALISILLAMVAGAVGALYYIPSAGEALGKAGLHMTTFRPIHTAFAHIWIYACAVGMIYYYLKSEHGELSAGDLMRFRLHTVLWCTAAVGILVTLGMGISTGREYLEFMPWISALFVAGWLLFAFTFFSKIRKGFWARPIYVYMWSIGILYFLYTFAEGHAYLFPGVFKRPLTDIALQWKAGGALVGSFNFLMYGAIMYAGERLSGDKRYAQSGIGFWLFAVGCINSFTNYAHHTYHVPQSDTIKWISFIISMIEIILLARVFTDLVRMVSQKSGPEFSATKTWMRLAKWWTFVMLFMAILISIPNLNSVIHGTHVVTGHAMGTELGIDTLSLFACIAFVLNEGLYRSNEAVRRRLNSRAMQITAYWVSFAVAALVLWLVASGLATGLRRMYGEAPPSWVTDGQPAFVVLGLVLAGGLSFLLVQWLPLFFGVEKRLTASTSQSAAHREVPELMKK